MSRFLRGCFVFILFASSMVGLQKKSAKFEPVDLVLFHGRIYTLNPQKPWAQAVAVRGEWIVAVSTDQELETFAGPATRKIDLHGQFLMPGFNDAHVHLGSAGRAKLQVNLEGTKSLAEFRQRIRERLQDYKPGEWVSGRGWDHTLWPENRFPSRQDLDAVSADHPMIFGRVDGHVAVANSKALRIAAITSDTPDPPGGRILKDAATGEPTGMLEEDAAMQLVYRHVPPISQQQRRRAIELALAEAARNGVTSIQDYSAWDDFLTYEQLKREGKLTLRITEWLDFTEPLAQLKEKRRHGGTTDAWLKTGAVKGFLDGSLGSRTAALLSPYSDDPSTTGILRMSPDEVRRMAIERDREKFQIALHAIGDRVGRVALDAFQAVRTANGARDRRDRLEHAQVLAPQDIPRLAQLGVIASMQPCHILSDARWAESRLGPERSRGAYAWNSLKKTGAHLAFGTDYPVEPVNPLRGLYACATRQLPEGGPVGGWQPQEKISVEDCIAGYTIGAAYAEFEENRKGKIRPGMLADFVVYPADLTRLSPKQLLQLQPSMTIVGGRLVFESK